MDEGMGAKYRLFVDRSWVIVVISVCFFFVGFVVFWGYNHLRYGEKRAENLYGKRG
jgi:hypothetical protein